MKASLVFKGKKKILLLVKKEEKEKDRDKREERDKFYPLWHSKRAADQLPTAKLYSLPVKQRNLAEIYRPDPLIRSGSFACFSNAEQL